MNFTNDPDAIKKIIRLQAIVRGWAFRTKKLPTLKNEYWQEVTHNTNNTINTLTAYKRHREVAIVTELLQKKDNFTLVPYLKNRPWLSTFPTELLLIIINHLNGLDLLRLVQTSSRFRRLISSEDIWELKVKNELSNFPRLFRGESYKDFYLRSMVKYQNTGTSYYTFLKNALTDYKQKQLSRYLSLALHLNADVWTQKLITLGALISIDVFENAITENAKDCLPTLLMLNTTVNINELMRSFFSSVTLFHTAAMERNLAALNLLFSQPNITVLPPLHVAAATGNLPELRRLLDQRIPINLSDPAGLPPLFWAIVMGKKEIVTELINRQASLDVEVPQHFPVYFEGYKYDINKTYVLIVYAFLFDRFDIVDILINRMPRHFSLSSITLRPMDRPRITLMQLLACLGGKERLSCFWSHDTSMSSGERNPLLFTTKAGHADCTNFLVDKRIPVNDRGEFRYQEDNCRVVTQETPLGNAAEGGYIDCINILLSAGADPNQTYKQYFGQKDSEDPSTSFEGIPLHKIASSIGDAGIWSDRQAFEAELASPRFAVEALEHTPLIHRYVQSLDRLLAVTKNVNAICNHHSTPIYGRTVLGLLIESISFRRAHSLPRYRYSLMQENYSVLLTYCVQLCFNRGVTMQNQNAGCGQLLLHEAAKAGLPNLVTLLLRKGANPHSLYNDKTPLQITTDSRCKKILEEAMVLDPLSHAPFTNALISQIPH